MCYLMYYWFTCLSLSNTVDSQVIWGDFKAHHLDFSHKAHRILDLGKSSLNMSPKWFLYVLLIWILEF